MLGEQLDRSVKLYKQFSCRTAKVAGVEPASNWECNACAKVDVEHARVLCRVFVHSSQLFCCLTTTVVCCQPSDEFLALGPSALLPMNYGGRFRVARPEPAAIHHESTATTFHDRRTCGLAPTTSPVGVQSQWRTVSAAGCATPAEELGRRGLQKKPSSAKYCLWRVEFPLCTAARQAVSYLGTQIGQALRTTF